MNSTKPMNTTFKTVLKRGLVIPALLFSLALSAQVRNFQVELPGGEMTYEEVIIRIESQCDVWFGYPTREVDVKRTVRAPQGAMSLGVLLDRIFNGTIYKYSIVGQHILIARAEATFPTLDQALKDPYYRINRSIPGSYTPYEVRQPSIVAKSNLLYVATTTLNLGVEIGLAPRWTLDIPFNYNRWDLGSDTRFRHWGFQPEGRYWFCQRFDGWFVGLHAHYAKFNIGGLPDWTPVSDNMKENRYQGDLYGAGVSVGYSWILKKRWSMEATVGLGYARINTTKYPCASCGTAIDKGGKNYFGPTKVGLSLIYTIK